MPWFYRQKSQSSPNVSTTAVHTASSLNRLREPTLHVHKRNKVDDLGLKVLVNPPSALVDIIAVHGLNGHRLDTWTSPETQELWLRDFLPADPDPNSWLHSARIITFGYDAYVVDKERISTQSLYEHATDFAEQVARFRMRTDTERRPIIFMAHSLGGILVKHALVYCQSATPGHLFYLKDVKVSTYGVLFFGTPHLGGNGVQAVTVILDSEHLQQLAIQYSPISNQFETVYFKEKFQTKILAGRTMMIVPADSAFVQGTQNAPAVDLQKDHISMVKFPSEGDADYRKVKGYLEEMAKDAPEEVKKKWVVEDRVRKV